MSEGAGVRVAGVRVAGVRVAGVRVAGVIWYLGLESQQRGEDPQHPVEPHFAGELWQHGGVLQQVGQDPHGQLHCLHRRLGLRGVVYIYYYIFTTLLSMNSHSLVNPDSL